VIAVRSSYTRDWPSTSPASSINPDLALKFRLSFDSRAFSIWSPINSPSPALPPSAYPLPQLLSMAMSLRIPSSPSDGASTSSSSHLPSPLTPSPIPESLIDCNTDSNSSIISPTPAGKRKPSRRANTAERRATHNAVERLRRETLNGRFLVSTHCRALVCVEVPIALP